MDVFVSWSGGKDCCLALYRALKAGFKVRYLFSMLGEDGLRSRGHGLSRSLLNAQSSALGIPIVYGRSSWETYEEEFKRVAENLKDAGIQGGVFGDINLEEHKEWVERVCGEIGIKAFEPLWNESYENLLRQFFGEGFTAVIVDVKKIIGNEWVGRNFDYEFVEYLENQGADVFGENGEYHTFVTYGPIFKRRIEILESRKTQRNGRFTLEILRFRLV